MVQQKMCDKHNVQYYPEFGCGYCTRERDKRQSEIRRQQDRHFRIEARFERLMQCATTSFTSPSMVKLWELAEEVEDFLESKRAEVKDGNV